MPRMSKKRKQEWALFLNERNRITYNGLCRKYSSEFSTPTISLPPCVLAKATIVFMYFSLLSGKVTLYSIFFDSPENNVSSTILSLLLFQSIFQTVLFLQLQHKFIRIINNIIRSIAILRQVRKRKHLCSFFCLSL